jgi:hypothetical protein
MGKSQVGHVTQSLSYFQANMFIIQKGFLVYDNNYSSIIDIYFYETFSISSQDLLALALNSLDTLSDVRKNAFTLFF